MSQLIVTSRYLKSGTKSSEAKRSNYTKYIATRESVEKRPQNNHFVTADQTQLINKLLKEYPIAKTYIEYEDYSLKSTLDNASELISTIIERHADVIGNRRNFVGYMAKRPGAERRGEHGLFNDSDKPIDLNAVANEVANHPGNIWTHVVSLRREDAVRLGYTNSDMWRELVKRHIADIAQAQNIPLSNLKWYAAFHNTTHHPHIHLIVYSSNPKQGYLTKQGIEKIRSVFANDIFQDDLKSIYQQQTFTRDELKALSENQMKEILSQIGSGEINEELVTSIKLLHDQLQTAKGKKVYGYLPKEIKQKADDIFSLLANDEHIKKLYEKWCGLESLKYKTYTLKPKTFPSLTDNKEFRSVKNMIIHTVLNMDKPLKDEPLLPPPESTDNAFTPQSIDYYDDYSPEDFIIDTNESTPVDVLEFTPSSKYTLKWSDDYKSARAKIYDKNSQSEDYKEAEKLLLSEAEKGNALAIHDLGKLYSNEKLGAKNEKKSLKYYQEALAAFMDIEPNADYMYPYTNNPRPKDMRSYVWYRIGKMHCYGLGTEQNYAEAFKWFEKSAIEGNKFAQFSLANLYYYGNGTRQSNEQAFRWYLAAAVQGQPYAAYAVAQMYATGESVDKDKTRAQEYYKQALTGFLKLEADEQVDDNLFYKLGRMFKLGLGTDIDMSKAIDYFQRAADHGNVNAKCTMALEYISGENVEQDIDNGIEMLTELTENGDTMSAYKLGKIYLSGEVVYADLNKAEKYLLQAAKDNNEYAMYSLAKLYLLDDKKDLAQAVKWLDKACKHESIKSYAAYAYAKILLDENVYHNTAKAIELLEETADKNNWCSYLLGKLYLFGNDDIEKDKEKALQWLNKSTEDGNEYAKALLQHAEDYEHSIITSTVISLFAHLAQIIEDDYMRRHSKMQSKTDRTLLCVIKKKKEELGLKSDTTLHYNY